MTGRTLSRYKFTAVGALLFLGSFLVTVWLGLSRSGVAGDEVEEPVEAASPAPAPRQLESRSAAGWTLRPTESGAEATSDAPPESGAEATSDVTPQDQPNRLRTWFSVQVGAFTSGENARNLAETLRGRGYDVHHVTIREASGRGLIAVRLGRYPDRQAAEAAAAEFRRAEGRDAIVREAR